MEITKCVGVLWGRFRGTGSNVLTKTASVVPPAQLPKHQLIIKLITVQRS